ncbi:proline iminopeptidase-family hydrolase [Mycobacterium sp.]|uniref:proline iminopeptidase-family hydrolase n=1 Tax=Mycobacterium sp. TaxID=1785 RepID=UPI003BAC1867
MSEACSASRAGRIVGPHGSIHYWIVGNADAVPLLVVHGGPGMPHNYLRDLDALGVDRPIIYYDQIGCGESDRPDDPSLWTVDTFVDELDTVRDALGLERVHVLGHSAGGWVAVEYALRAPAGLASLILANTSTSLPLSERDVSDLVDALPSGAGTTTRRTTGPIDDAAYVAAVRSFAQHVYRCDPVPDYVEQALTNINRNVFATTLGNLVGWDITHRLGELTLPVLVASGRHDPGPAEAVREMADAIRGSVLAIFEDSGHLPMISEKASFIRVVRTFLIV